MCIQIETCLRHIQWSEGNFQDLVFSFHHGFQGSNSDSHGKCFYPLNQLTDLEICFLFLLQPVVHRRMNTVSLQGRGGVFMEAFQKLRAHPMQLPMPTVRTRGANLSSLLDGSLPESLEIVSKSSSQNNIKTKQNKKVAIQR